MTDFILLSTCSSVLETVAFIASFEPIFIWLNGVTLGLFTIPEEPANIPNDCCIYTITRFAIDKSKTKNVKSRVVISENVVIHFGAPFGHSGHFFLAKTYLLLIKLRFTLRWW